MGADHILVHLEFLGASGGNLFQGEFHAQAQVGSAVLGTLTASAAKAAAKAAESRVAAEDVAKSREDVVHGEASRSTKASEASRSSRAVEAELVVLLAFLGVVEHVVGLSGLLEFLLGLLVARVAVGVVLDGELAVSSLYLIF